tara:strand:+ start:874 stop:1881 length:1008 start_codon:yes stop_codon:yes gene_type:complete
MTDTTITTACNQRRTSLLFNIPPVRNEIVSPYPAYTQEQLNMRRKVEILKYKKNSTQSRQMTAKEKQSQILKGNYRGNTLYCENDYSIPVSTSASDVPGPIIKLVEDKSIPLYNYLPNTLSNAITIDENETEWSFYILPNVTCPAGLDNTTNIATLLIRDAIKKNTYNYTYTTPIAFTISGSNIPIDASGAEINVNINNPDSKIFYGADVINNDTSVLSFENTNFKIKLSPSNISSSTFSYNAQLYVGNITISNIALTTSPGFSYNIGISYNASKSVSQGNAVDFDTTSLTTTANNTTFSIKANINDNLGSITTENCEIETTESTASKLTSFSGL